MKANYRVLTPKVEQEYQSGECHYTIVSPAYEVAKDDHVGQEMNG